MAGGNPRWLRASLARAREAEARLEAACRGVVARLRRERDAARAREILEANAVLFEDARLKRLRDALREREVRAASRAAEADALRGQARRVVEAKAAWLERVRVVAARRARLEAQAAGRDPTQRRDLTEPEARMRPLLRWIEPALRAGNRIAEAAKGAWARARLRPRLMVGWRWAADPARRWALAATGAAVVLLPLLGAAATVPGARYAAALDWAHAAAGTWAGVTAIGVVIAVAAMGSMVVETKPPKGVRPIVAALPRLAAFGIGAGCAAPVAGLLLLATAPLGVAPVDLVVVREVRDKAEIRAYGGWLVQVDDERGVRAVDREAPPEWRAEWVPWTRVVAERGAMDRAIRRGDGPRRTEPGVQRAIEKALMYANASIRDATLACDQAAATGHARMEGLSHVDRARAAAPGLEILRALGEGAEAAEGRAAAAARAACEARWTGDVATARAMAEEAGQAVAELRRIADETTVLAAEVAQKQAVSRPPEAPLARWLQARRPRERARSQSSQ